MCSTKILRMMTKFIIAKSAETYDAKEIGYGG